jgi:hydroxymethylpyrimidine/phosphomethylpyrimidine kinase
MEEISIPCACTIAGSDSGAGAGIQADLKTFSALDVWGVTVITAVTAQNTTKVTGIWPLPPDAVRLQMEAVFEDYPIKAMKSGMLANRDIIRAVVRSLPAGIPFVLDPVIRSTSGHRLLEQAAIEELTKRLLPRATIVTPNIPEAEILSGIRPITTLNQMRSAAQKILTMGPKAVIIKGGHLKGGKSVDIFLDSNGEIPTEAPRLPFEVHGSGCCFSAALTAFLAHGFGPKDAFSRTKEYMGEALSGAVTSLSGRRSVQPYCGTTQEKRKPS